MKRSSKKINSILFHTSSILLTIVLIYPLIWLLSSSFKDNAEVFVQSHKLVPDVFHFENYVNGWKGFGSTTFLTFFKNSIITSVLSTLGYIASSALAAYGFVRLKFKGKNFWFATVMICMLLPKQVLMVPQYILFHKFNWINTFNPIILPPFFAGPSSPFFIFLVIQFMRGIPYELDESATIDGCGKIRIFWNIILPHIKPALVTVGIFAFYWQWEDFVSPMLYLNRPSLYTVSVALKLFADPNSVTNWGSMFAMSILSLIPVLIVFFIFQKNIVEGISTTGLKG